MIKYNHFVTELKGHAMGLAASQARFLAITARKADLEFRSMSIAQEKLSITRQLSQASSDYEEALDSTKLVWDYDDDTSYDLTYDILMSPSELNGYTPYILTNAAGKVVLSDTLAIAAANVEFNGSEEDRNTFVQALANVGYISGSTADCITGADGNGGVEYSSLAGLGGDSIDKTLATSMTLGTMVSYFESIKDLTETDLATDYSDYEDLYNSLNSLSTALSDILTTNENTTLYVNGSEADSDDDLSISGLLEDDMILLLDSVESTNITELVKALLNSDFCESGYSSCLTLSDAITYLSDSNDGILASSSIGTNEQEALAALVCMIANIGNVFYTALCDDEETDTTQAFEFAMMQTLNLLSKYSEDNSDKKLSTLIDNAEDQNGLLYSSKKGTGAISLSNIVSMFLTNYAIALDGYSSGYYIGETADDSEYVTDDLSYAYILNNPNSYYDEKDLMIADFINVLYNQICTKGWTTCEGGDLNDSEFLQSAIKSGKYFISALAEDGYYYQTAYTQTGCVSEVTDEDAITLAEAEYDRIQTDLNYKEETLDLELQNLDLEISSLTTEYDTVKSMISKNIEKVFTMFSS